MTHTLTPEAIARLTALADAYEPGCYGLADGVYHVYRDVHECCQTLRDDIRAAISPEAIALLNAAVRREKSWSKFVKSGSRLKAHQRAQLDFSLAAEAYARSLEPKEPK